MHNVLSDNRITLHRGLCVCVYPVHTKRNVRLRGLSMTQPAFYKPKEGHTQEDSVGDALSRALPGETFVMSSGLANRV